jgi:K+-transporting ATPase ATPase C chain
MKRQLTTAAVAVVLFTLLLGAGYPLAITAVSQLAFPGAANGSKLTRDGRVVGSRLVAQAFTKPVLDARGRPRHDAAGDALTAPDPRYFQPRPSATGYSATATFFANRGPNSAAARDFYRDALAAYLALERPHDPSLTARAVPVDAVTTSGSGVDPQISIANAHIQAHRVAAVRGIALARVDALVDQSTDGRFAGIAGEPGVNVLELDLALDRSESR